ncbi:serine/arginine repetitive matrix protein 1-like [Punica granatum]|uniref:Uncharacterized protein n=2 Tax=Punica granatum TaxID=22663 RepID=A0A218WXZ8_PUNGR|nr:serine/arginine repetitive matrix protein 1-like [Punica granatum]OWM77513.1 hypothetical protein CDL15_Pgr016911 [Punica granatum]PKI77576.1 hypothetical protein CRG98_002030 [Punica granatum]
MGCCVSSHNNGTKATATSASASWKQRRSPAKPSRAPLPPSMEEETVKEVLSETPTPKPPIHLVPASPTRQPQNPEPQQKKPPPPPSLPVFPEPLLLSQKAEIGVVKGKEDGSDRRLEELMPKPAAEEISEEVSDICSLSESVSISTATNLTDDSGVHHQGHRGAYRSPAKIQSSRAARSLSGEMGARRVDHTAQSQYRRSDQSPRRRNAGPVRPIQGGEPNRARSVPRRRERDPGESSARRSRSPAMTRVENHGSGGTRSGVGRSPSARKTNPSPGRVRGDPNERRSRDLDGNNGKGGNLLGLDSKQPDGDESLENPLVSLECFIFL